MSRRAITGARIGRSFALALVAGGRARHGEPVWATLPDRTVAARICPPVFYDPDGQAARWLTGCRSRGWLAPAGPGISAASRVGGAGYDAT